VGHVAVGQARRVALRSGLLRWGMVKLGVAGRVRLVGVGLVTAW